MLLQMKLELCELETINLELVLYNYVNETTSFADWLSTGKNARKSGAEFQYEGIWAKRDGKWWQQRRRKIVFFWFLQRKKPSELRWLGLLAAIDWMDSLGMFDGVIFCWMWPVLMKQFVNGDTDTTSLRLPHIQKNASGRK